MSNEPTVAPFRKSMSRLRRWGCGCLLAFVAIIATFVASLAIRVWLRYDGDKRAFADAIDRIKRSGAPVSAEDLTALHAVEPGEFDLTAAYLAALDQPAMLDQVASEFDDLPLVRDSTSRLPKLSEPWPDLEQTEQYLAGRTWLAELEELGRRDGQVAPAIDFSKCFAAELPHAQSAWKAAKDFRLASAVRVRRGDREGALSAAEGLAGCARVVERDPYLVCGLVRLGMSSRTLEQAKELLDGGHASVEEIARLRRIVPKDLWAHNAYTCNGERATAIHFLRNRRFADFEKEFDAELPLVNWFSSPGALAESRPADARAALVFYNESLSALRASTFHESVTLLVAAERRRDRRQQDAVAARIWDKQVLSAMGLAFSSCAASAAHREASRRALLVALDVEERLAKAPAEQRSVRWVEDYLRTRFVVRSGENFGGVSGMPMRTEEAPTDDPVLGGRLVCRVDANGYVVYSLCFNGIDDGGDLLTPPGKAVPLDAGFRVDRPLIESNSVTEP